MSLRLILATREALPPTVLAFPRPDGLPASPSLCLFDEISGREVWAQVDPIDGRTVYLPIDGLDAGTRRGYTWSEKENDPPGSQGVELFSDGSGLAIDIRGERFTRYHYLPGDAPARPFFYPVLAPGGIPVTRGYPMAEVKGEKRDHPHHRSLWVAHGDVNGADNWSEEPGHGRTEHLAFTGQFSGPVAGGFRETTRWVTAAGDPLMEEVRDVRVYAAPGPVRILDLTLRLTPSRGEVTFGDTKEGGLISVRVATSMDANQRGSIRNANGGRNEGETWGKPSAWCDYYGPVQGRTLGIALMDHPDNPRFPTYWHVRDYGLMTANPFGLSHYYNDRSKNGSRVFPAGETSVWRYRMLVHEGDTETARVGMHHAAFASPIEATIQ